MKPSQLSSIQIQIQIQIDPYGHDCSALLARHISSQHEHEEEEAKEHDCVEHVEQNNDHQWLRVLEEIS
jgi:hypothetical protein